MADISKITVNSTGYNIKDATARAHLAWYGTCSTTASKTTKDVTCGGFTLAEGTAIDVKFTVTNTGAVGSLKLDVNSTGAKAIKYRGGNLPAAGTLTAGRVYRFVYDGTNYELIGDLDTNTQTVTGVKGNSESSYRTGDVNITAANIGLGNVDNKSSATIRSEITSSNVTTALGYTPLDASLKGANSGVAELDEYGKVPSSQLPSYVDDVVEYAKKDNFPVTGETGKIYVAIDTNKTYRWSGSEYVEISESLALGTTSSTAFRGDYGSSAYTHAVTNKGSAFSSGLYKITTNSEGHVTAATAVVKSDITGLGIPGTDTNTHRPIQINGTEVLGDNTTALNLKPGANVSITNNSGTVTIAAVDTTYAEMTASSSGAAGTNGLVPAPAAGSQNKFLRGDATWQTPTDTKNTAGATDSSSKLFLIGATSQDVSPQTYSQDTAYIGTDGCLYSGGTKVLTAHQNISGKVDGPESSTDSHVAIFDGQTGKAVKDSGFTIGKSVPSNAVFTDTTYESKAAANGGTDVSLVTTGEKYTWNNKSDLALGSTSTTAAAGNHTHATTIATSSGTNQITLAASTKYSITAGGTSYIFTTPPNTTYSAITDQEIDALFA